jgi:hypothetical protein
MNRVREEQEEESPRPIGVDHFVVNARSETWYVSTEMARHIEACLDVEHRHVWISFVDLSGARVRVRSREVEYLAQSTSTSGRRNGPSTGRRVQHRRPGRWGDGGRGRVRHGHPAGDRGLRRGDLGNENGNAVAGRAVTAFLLTRALRSG